LAIDEAVKSHSASISPAVNVGNGSKAVAAGLGGKRTLELFSDDAGRPPSTRIAVGL
jgi:hypothetical protein